MRARRGQSGTLGVRPSSRTRSVDVHAHAHGRAFKSARGRGCLRVSLLQPAPHLSGSHVVVSVQRHRWLRVSLLQPAPRLSGSHVVVSAQRHRWLRVSLLQPAPHLSGSHVVVSVQRRRCRVSLLQPAPHLSGSHVVVSVQRHCWLAPQLGVFPRRCKFNQEWCTEARKQTAAPPRIRQDWKLAVQSVWCAWAALATPCSRTARHATTRVARNVRMRCSRMVGAVQSVGGQSMLCCVCLVPKNIDGCHRSV